MPNNPELLPLSPFKCRSEKAPFFVALICAVLPAITAAQVGSAGTVGASVQDRVIHQSAAGLWALTYDVSKPGMNCGVTYVSTKNKDTTLAFKGPTPTLASGSIIFAGPAIPSSAVPTDTRVDMLFEGEAPANVRAIHFPRTGNVAYVLVPTGDIKASIDPIRDVEKNMGLMLNGAQVYKFDYDGGKVARAAMLDCLAGRSPPPTALAANENEPRPTGNSRISGQAYAKVAVLARSQYPPKGWTVQLILVTNELKAWFEQAKVNGSSAIPAKFRHLLWIAKVHDDEGRFMFDKLPPGEYLTWVSFDYYKNRTVHERTGNATVRTINNQVVSVEQGVYSSQVAVNQGANIEQSVVISKDGDSAVIELKKTQFLDIN